MVSSGQLVGNPGPLTPPLLPSVLYRNRDASTRNHNRKTGVSAAVSTGMQWHVGKALQLKPHRVKKPGRCRGPDVRGRVTPQSRPRMEDALSTSNQQWPAHRILVLGGMGSGKSSYAESLITDIAPDNYGHATYIATAEARDADMAARIEQHKVQRGAGWRTVEEPLDIAIAVRQHGVRRAPVLIECLSLWLSNLLEAGRNPAAETADLIAALAAVPAPVVLVANEVGLGGVPGNALARKFSEAAGAMNQTVAAVCDHVVLVAAGLPLSLKSKPTTSIRTRLA